MKAYKKAVIAFAAVAALVPALAVAGNSDSPKITGYQNAKGNKISSTNVNKSFYIVGSKLNKVENFACYSGKVEGERTWATMEHTHISSSLVQAWPNAECTGFTGPVRGSYYSGETFLGYVYGPDLAVTGTPAG